MHQQSAQWERLRLFRLSMSKRKYLRLLLFSLLKAWKRSSRNTEKSKWFSEIRAFNLETQRSKLLYKTMQRAYNHWFSFIKFWVYNCEHCDSSFSWQTLQQKALDQFRNILSLMGAFIRALAFWCRCTSSLCWGWFGLKACVYCKGLLKDEW